MNALDFHLSDINKQAIDIYALAGYSVKLGDRVFYDKNGPTKTYSVFDSQSNKVAGVSSTALLTPSFAMKDIKSRAFRAGLDKGKLLMRADFRKLIGLID